MSEKQPIKAIYRIYRIRKSTGELSRLYGGWSVSEDEQEVQSVIAALLRSKQANEYAYTYLIEYELDTEL